MYINRFSRNAVQFVRILAFSHLLAACGSSGGVEDASNYQWVDIRDLFDRPGEFASQDVLVSGFLLWHPDEPLLFVGESDYEAMEFDRSIHLENPEDVDLSTGDRKRVTIAGRFHYLDYVPPDEYGGFIRVHHTVSADTD